MDWPDRKSNYQKHPPDKKAKPKYIAKDQAQTQKSEKVQEKPYAEKKYTNNNQNNKNKKFESKSKQENLEAPRFVQKMSSVEAHLTCSICVQPIGKRQPIWTCQSCCISLHLRCIKQWIRKTNQNRLDQPKKKFIFNWSCIQCKTEYNENMPQYYCYCGKFKEPENDRDLEPHSCGKPCQKKRGTYCPHLCPQLCHSGKCKPCEHEGELIKCNCGKTERMAKCSEERAIFQCGKKCEKTLKCGKHKCQRNCHYGECYPCKKKHLVGCYCNKNQDVVDCATNAYACESVCEKLLNCGYHKCQKDCHAGACGECQKSPQNQKTCSCGRYQLMMISEVQRQSCRDPVPSCGMPCKKKLSCGHECPQTCHEGRCNNCKIIVTQACRCGNSQRKIQCYKARQTKDQFHCDKVCKKKKNCGIHVCNTQCCKFRNLIGPETHQCELNCTRMLNCQKHTCDMPCHAGNCKKCPVIYSQPQPCPCGTTSLRPPVLCGTITPQCGNSCNKVMQCGHKCQELCHYGSCRCLEQVMVTCRCGMQKIKTICGRQALCLTKCPKVLECGHKCLVQCHTGTCQQANKNGCYQKCDKTRTDCGHKCRQICHLGKKCDQFPCEAEILIKCECGHRQKTILCGAQGNNDATHKKKQIMCNKKCENTRRFDIFYKDKQIYYSNSLVQYGLKYYNQLQKIEEKVHRFISESDQHFVQVQFKHQGDNHAKSALHNLFQNHYHLNTHFYRHMKNCSFTLTQTQHTMIPKPCLSDYIDQVTKGIIKRTNLPFQYTIKFDGESKIKADAVTLSLKPFLHKYYIQRKDKMYHVHFWNKEQGLYAHRVLEHENMNMDFYGEQNVSSYEEMEEFVEDSEIVETEVEGEGEGGQSVGVEDKGKGEGMEMEQEKKVESSTEAKQGGESGEKQQTVPGETTKKQSLPEGEAKPKIIIKTKQTPKIVIRKGAPNFVRSQFPPSSQNVQDLYIIDEDELFGQAVDWDNVIKQLLEKKMGIEASQWRIRAMIMISNFHSFDPQLLRQQFERITDLYQKDKEKAKRILQIQRLQLKKIKQQMGQNQIYLSDHQPQILSYCLLFDHLHAHKVQFQVPDQCLQTREIQHTLSILQHIRNGNYQQFYTQFKNSDYLFACMLTPFIDELREGFLKNISNSQRVPVMNLHKYLLFDSEEQLHTYAKNNGITLNKRSSKSKKIEEYTLLEGQLLQPRHKENNFKSKIEEKRDKGYFLSEPQELIEGKYMTRSFFAFGDFRESVSPKYMLGLCRMLRDGEC